MRNTSYSSLKIGGLFFLIALAVVWMVFAVGREVDEKSAEPMCPISGPKGPWDYYQMGDLPRGDCSGAQDCTVWTKDSCPGADYPGPGIKWKCVCDSGTWRCDEQERTKSTCVTR
jgi:hypothetical protein